MAPLQMKILHVPCAYAPTRGGTQHLCQELSERMARLGHEVRVMTSNVVLTISYVEHGYHECVGPLREKLNGVDIRRFPFISFEYKLSGFLSHHLKIKEWSRTLRKNAFERYHRRFKNYMERHIGDFRPDVVMALPHLTHNVRHVLEIRKKRKFPLVLFPLLHELEAYWPYADLKEALPLSDAVLAATDHEARVLRDDYGVPSQKIFSVGIGVDLPATVKAPEHSSRRVLFLGRKVKTKGIGLLLDAMRLVWEKHPDAELVFAGAKTEDHSWILDRINELPLNQQKQVRSLDDITEGEKARLLESSCVLVLPSQYESFGVVILEAWAYGLPVVALDIPVMRDIVEPGKDSLLVPRENAPALAESVISLLNNRAKASEMGQAGRKKIEERYTWEKLIPRYIEAYQFAAKN